MSQPYFYRVFPQRHGDGREYRFHVGEIPPLDTQTFATTAGDCLFNLRAALDHLVYELHVKSARGRISSEAAQAAAFPILDAEKLTRRGTPDTAKWNDIRRLPANQRRAIEFLQPYKTRNDQFARIRAALADIERLNNIDKHRHLHVVTAAVQGSSKPWFGESNRYCSETFYVPLVSQTEVFRWTFHSVPPSDVAAEVNVDREVYANVCLDEAGSYPELAPMLQNLIDAVEAVLRRFEVFLPPTI